MVVLMVTLTVALMLALTPSAPTRQAQRDLFGAHTYERTDKEGSFHSDWAK